MSLSKLYTILIVFLFSNFLLSQDVILSLDGNNLNYQSSTNIEIGIAEDGHLNIQVLDLNGRIIDTIYDGFIGSGYYIKNWDAVDFPSGIYIVQMNINGFHDSQKVILIK